MVGHDVADHPPTISLTRSDGVLTGCVGRVTICRRQIAEPERVVGDRALVLPATASLRGHVGGLWPRSRYGIVTDSVADWVE